MCANAVSSGIIYASVHGAGSQERLAASTNSILSTIEELAPAKVLWTMSFTLDEAAGSTPWNSHVKDDATKSVIMLPERAHDLAFDDAVLDSVKDAWETILGERSIEYDFLRFEDRKDPNEDD